MQCATDADGEDGQEEDAEAVENYGTVTADE